MESSVRSRSRTSAPDRPRSLRGAARSFAWGLALLAVAAAAATVGVRSLEAPPAEAATAFDVERALVDLERVSAAPRVMGTPELAEARAYLVERFEALGLEPEVDDSISVHAGPGFASVSRSNDVVVRIPGRDSSGAVLLAGHLDSVHTTGAASDCGGCSVTVLEVARALLEGEPLRNDVILLMEDGEETSRAGSLAFVERHRWAEDVRVAVNLEAMGSSGASLLYVSGPGNGWVVEQAIRAMPHPVVYSFLNDLIWGSGTGGSDLDQFLLRAPVGVGFAYVGNVPAYHTVRDSVASLDPRTLQHQGDNALALVRRFGNLPLGGELTAPDLVSFNLAGDFVVRYGQPLGVALALLALLLAAAVAIAGVRRGRFTTADALLGAALLLPLALIATALCAALWYALRVLDGRLQVFLIGISYDRPLYTLALVLLGMALVAAGYALLRRRSPLGLAAGAAFVWSLLALATAFALPGSSYLFTLPVLAVVPALAATVLGTPRPLRAGAWLLAVALSVLVLTPAVAMFGIFSGRAEVLTGLPAVALLPVPLAALLAALLLPALARAGGRWGAPAALGAAALLIVVGIGATARFDEDRPKPTMVAYVLDADSGAAEWVSVAAGPAGRRDSLLDPWTTRFLGTDPEPVSDFSPWGGYGLGGGAPGYRAPAPALDLPAPAVEVVSDRTDAEGRRRLELRLHAPVDAPTLVVTLDAPAGIERAAIAGEPQPDLVAGDAPPTRLGLMIYAPPPDGIGLELTLAGASGVDLDLAAHTYALPAALEPAPRPEWMIPAPAFVTDTTIVERSVAVP